MPTIPTCQGTARYVDSQQAAYVAKGMREETGDLWVSIPCGDHWHVMEHPS